MSSRSDNKNNALAQELGHKGMTDDMEREWLSDRLGYLALQATSLIPWSANLTEEVGEGIPAWDLFSDIEVSFGEDGIFGAGSASLANDNSATGLGNYRHVGIVILSLPTYPTVITYRTYIKKDPSQAGLYLRWTLQTTGDMLRLASYTVEYNTGVGTLVEDALTNPVFTVDDGALTGYDDWWVIYYQFDPQIAENAALFGGVTPAYSNIAGGVGDVSLVGKAVHGNMGMWLNRTIDQMRQLRTVRATETQPDGYWPGRAEQTAGITNQDMWLDVFIQDGATSGDFNDAAYEWLIIQGVIPAALPEMWDAYWISLLTP